MKLLPYEQAHFPDACQTYRNQSWRGLAGAAVVIGAVAMVVSLPKSEESATNLAWMPGLFALALGVLCLERLRVCRKPTGWLLKSTDEGLFINLRSFHNYHLPRESHRVLFVPADEVAAVCKTHEIQLVPGRRRPHRDQYSFVDIFLKEGISMAPLVQALREERRAEAPAGGRWRRAKRDEYPVRVLDPPGVRLVWDWIKPGEGRALDLLGERYPIAPDQRTTARRWEHLNAEEQEALVLQYWEWGQVEDAVSLGRMLWGVGAYRARKRLQELAAVEPPRPEQAGRESG